MRKLVLVVLAVLSLLAVAPVTATATATAAEPPTAFGQAIVGFDRGFLPDVGVGGVLNGLVVSRVSKNGSFVTVAAPSLGVVRDALAALPGVSYVEDNGVMHALVTPNDARFGEQYGPGQMGFPAAWGSVGYGSSGVIVAVIDSGVLSTHQDLAGPRLLPGWDYVSNDATPNDTCGHGTHVTGTVGASTNNAAGVAGMAQATLLPMKVLRYVEGGLLGGGSGCSGSHDAIAAGIIDAADQGAKVISMSIGGPASSTLLNAVDYAAGKGAILVAAAGNGGQSNGVDYPAAYPNVIAVGALTSSKAKASYSDSGSQLDIAAPGSDVLSTYTGSNTAYASANGTSMATPHVAGALALALGCAPAGTTREAVVNALYSTAEDLGVVGRDDSFGSGLARADRLVTEVCGGGEPTNWTPTAAFTATASGTLGVAVNASTSSDRDGDALSYAWAFGDGATATGVTASHTYAAAGTYTITLTVNDGQGTDQLQKSFNAVSDPDPSTKTVTSGQKTWFNLSSSAKQRFVKIFVPEGTTQLQAQTITGSCTSCPLNTDLYTRAGARPTNTAFACRAATSTSDETCTTSNPASGYWYVRVKWTSGAGRVRLTVTLS